jgi:membrane protein DedA with SNARE-associated domain
MATLTPSVIAAHAHWAEWALFVWILANQGGVPIPVVPALLGAGALAGSGSLSVVVTLAVSVAAALSADLTWYLLGRWRGSRALDLLTRLVPKARTHVQGASQLLTAHPRLFQLSARFLPVVNPIAAGLAGAAGMSVSRFLPGAAVSAAVWSGSWIGIGYLLTHGGAGLARSFGIPLTLVVIATLVAWLLVRQAQRRLLLHALGRASAGRGSSVASRSPSSS